MLRRVTVVVLLAGTVASLAAARPSPGVTSGPMPPDPHRVSPWAWEPGMSIDAQGVIWVVGNHCALVDQHGFCQLDRSRHGSPDYTPLWRSTDGGRTYRFIADPLRQLEATGVPAGGDRPGGNDTDVAVAPVAPSGGAPLLYVVSAWGASSTLAISGDSGHTWRLSQLNGLPAQDRPWLATSGRCDVYLEYHLITGGENILAPPRVDHFNGCSLFRRAAGDQVAAVPETSTPIEPVSNFLAASDQDMAKLVASGRNLYAAYLMCNNPSETNLNCDSPGDHQSLHVAVSRNDGATFTDLQLPDADLHGPLNDGTWPLSAAADSHGDVIVSVTDTHHVYLWISRDGARHWLLRARPVDGQLGWAGTAVPSVGVQGRRLAVGWYGGPPTSGHSPHNWYLFVARSWDGGRTFRIRRLGPVLAQTPHGQPLADKLYDDFGIELTPDGATAVAYSQSCAGHSPSSRTCPWVPPQAGVNALIIRYAWLAGRRP